MKKIAEALEDADGCIDPAAFFNRNWITDLLIKRLIYEKKHLPELFIHPEEWRELVDALGTKFRDEIYSGFGSTKIKNGDLHTEKIRDFVYFYEKNNSIKR